MTASNDTRKNFAELLRYNINRYQHMTNTQNKKLAGILGLKEHELEERFQDIQSFTAWEIHQCAQHFGCTHNMLYPDTRLTTISRISKIAANLPTAQLNYLCDNAMILARQVKENKLLEQML